MIMIIIIIIVIIIIMILLINESAEAVAAPFALRRHGRDLLEDPAGAPGAILYTIIHI